MDYPNDLYDFFPPTSPSDDGSAMAYVRPVMTDKGNGYGVYSVDGLQLAIFPTRDEAYFAAKQHDLEPVLIH